MSNLFLCSVGPVQEFIATARSSGDLWYGSWMLSELSKAAAQALQQIPATQLIYPAPPDPSALSPSSDLNVANKVLAQIEDRPDEVAKSVYDVICERLHSLRDNAFPPAGSPNFNYELACRQVDDLVEFYWVSVPYDPADYTGCRERAEALLAARKNTRDFAPFAGDAVPKSSLDASRESVIDEAAYPNGRTDDEATRQKKINDLFGKFGARRGERLSGVDLLKRKGRIGGARSFPSTAEMAARPFLDALPNRGDDLMQKLDRYMQGEWQVDAGGDLAEVLYPGRLRQFLPDPDVPKAEQEIRQMVDAEISKLPGDPGRGLHPGPYYALLSADGDGMGALLDRLSSVEANQGFSRALSSYAQNARQIIQKHEGAAIYAGGDDVLAYLPVHTALACLRELQQAFGQAMASLAGGLSAPSAGDPPRASLSGGLVIAHFMQPLSEVLGLARAAEKRAKELPGKNALCVVLNKRSGAERSVRDHWNDLIGRLEGMADLYRQKALSRGAAYEIQDLYVRLEGAGLPKSALEEEAVSILERKRETGGGKKLTPETLAQLRSWLPGPSDDRSDKRSGRDFALELIVAEVFAEA